MKNKNRGYLLIIIMYGLFIWNLFYLKDPVDLLWWVNLIFTLIVVALIGINSYIMGKMVGKEELIEDLKQ